MAPFPVAPPAAVCLPGQKVVRSLVRKLKSGALACTVLAALSAPTAAHAQWQSQGKLRVPSFSYNFLASTPNGDLLAATYNTNASGGASASLPALLIRNPGSPEPEVVELCRQTFDAQRGYGGIASDSTGAFFVSGDTGSGATSFLRKFNSDGTPDRAFGNNGEVRPGNRCLGIDTLGSYVFLAVDWGTIQVYDAKSGRYLSALPKAPGETYVRDITIDPKSMRLFGVAQGGVMTWGHSAPWKAASYQFRTISPPITHPRSGEGLSIDPFKRCLVVTPHPGQTVMEIYGTGQVVKSPVTSAKENSHLGDNTLSFDGSTLYISDMTNRAIHVMRREMPKEPQFIALASPPINSGAGIGGGTAVPAPKWQSSYVDVVQQAREAGKPMLIYFRKAGVRPCEEFEAKVLKSNEFNQRAARYVCVHEDATKNRLLAYRFGVARLPHVVLIDAQGEVKQEFSVNIDPAQLFAGMETAGK